MNGGNFDSRLNWTLFWASANSYVVIIIIAINVCSIEINCGTDDLGLWWRHKNKICHGSIISCVSACSIVLLMNCKTDIG